MRGASGSAIAAPIANSVDDRKGSAPRPSVLPNVDDLDCAMGTAVNTDQAELAEVIVDFDCLGIDGSNVTNSYTVIALVTSIAAGDQL